MGKNSGRNVKKSDSPVLYPINNKSANDSIGTPVSYHYSIFTFGYPNPRAMLFKVNGWLLCIE